MTILESLFHPKSIAVIGASDNPNKVGGRPIHYMKKFGYQGRILPINPARKQIQGIDAYDSIESLKTSPDAAIIAVGSESVLDQVRLCADRGVGAVVIMASGFGELGEEGKGIEAELVKVAQAKNMRLVGPNAQGTANFSNGAILNFSTMFMEIDPQDGPVAVISQSGAASVMPYALLRKAGYGVRYIVATGNDADISASTIAEELARDEQIKLILVYLESLTDPERLASAAATARQRGAYIIALKSGASKIGAAAASSHTGAIVGDDVAVNAFLARHGIWRAHDMNGLIRTVPLYLKDHLIRKGRTVAMSHSGAVSVMIADSAERMGMPLSDISAETKAKLAAVLPSFATPSNPLDMTAASSEALISIGHIHSYLQSTGIAEVLGHAWMSPKS
ncbi:CoA-binding protein [Bradyrhizobium sp. B124]|uniref:CoA-binding protein n=1 Tax=Bradyrhizobium sp. B124 TaxID=3140245 RepID=UPI003183B145